MVQFKLKRGKKIYHIQEFGSVLELARRGLIAPDDPIFVPAANRWTYARCIQELRPVLREDKDQDLALDLPPEFVEPLEGDFGGMSIEIDAGTLGVSAYPAPQETSQDGKTSEAAFDASPHPKSPFETEDAALSIPTSTDPFETAPDALFDETQAPTASGDWEDEIPTDPGVPKTMGQTPAPHLPPPALENTPAKHEDDLWAAPPKTPLRTTPDFKAPDPDAGSVWDAPPIHRIPDMKKETPPLPSPFAASTEREHLNPAPNTPSPSAKTSRPVPMNASSSTASFGQRSSFEKRTPPASSPPEGRLDEETSSPTTRSPASLDTLELTPPPKKTDAAPAPPPSFQAWVEEQAKKSSAQGTMPPVIPLLTTGETAGSESRRMLTLDPLRLAVSVGILVVAFGAFFFFLKVTANQEFEAVDIPPSTQKAPEAVASSAKPPPTPPPVFDDSAVRAQIKPRLSPMRTFEQAEEELFIELINLKAAIADVKIEPLSGERKRSVRTERSDIIVRLRPGEYDLETTAVTIGLVVGKYVSRKIHDGGRIRVRNLVLLHRPEEGDPMLAMKVKGETMWSYYHGGVNAQVFLSELKENLSSAAAEGYSGI